MQDDLPLETTVTEVHEMLRARSSLLLLDCREPDEHALAAIAGARLIPMAEIPSSFTEIAAAEQERIVVICHHGVRSLHVARWLRGQGLGHVQSMAGGIDRWSAEVDPEVPRYW